jgi:hypothetical protein
MTIPAVVAAGDRGAARAIYGESKAFLEIEGRPLVAHIVRALQRVPEVSEVWVVGDPERLAPVLGAGELSRELSKSLRVMPQAANLYENAWQAYRRVLPGAAEAGRDPAPDDLDQRVLYLSADMPFATAEEISLFVRRGLVQDCDYSLGLVTEESLRGFYPGAGAPGIRMAYFNLREGRFRQSNLHLVRPGRLGNRHYIEEMYRHRHQREFGPIARLAWQLLSSERGGLSIVTYYALMHLAGAANRRGWRGAADLLRRAIPMARIERGCGQLLRTHLRFAVTEIGGCAVDVDNEHDFEVARERFAEWTKAQRERAQAAPQPSLGPG